MLEEQRVSSSKTSTIYTRVLENIRDRVTVPQKDRLWIANRKIHKNTYFCMKYSLTPATQRLLKAGNVSAIPKAQEQSQHLLL